MFSKLELTMLQQGSVRTKAKPGTKPQCTHTTVGLLHGDFECEVCHRVPAIGWVYCCDQDICNDQISLAVTGRNSLDSKQPLSVVQEFEALGFHPTVIQGVRTGFYTKSQINRLRIQKQHVQQTAKLALQDILSTQTTDLQKHAFESHQIDEGSRASTDASVLLPAENPANNHSKSQRAKKRKRTPIKLAKNRTSTKCDFKVCHRCRPFFKDRLMISPEAAYMDELGPLSDLMQLNLPIQDAGIVRNLGLRPYIHDLDFFDSSDSGSRLTFGPFDTIFTDDGESANQGFSRSQTFYGLESLYAADATPSCDLERSESKGFRTSLRKALEDMIKRNRESSLDDTSLSVLEESSTVRARRKREERLEDMLFQSMSDGVLKEASAIALPDEDDDSLAEELDVNGAMEGGVALTEEAVLNHSPDVIMQI